MRVGVQLFLMEAFCIPSSFGQDILDKSTWNPPLEDGGTIVPGLGGPYMFTYLGGLAKWGFWNFLHFLGDNGQSLLKFICLFQVKFNFSIENISSK